MKTPAELPPARLLFPVIVFGSAVPLALLLPWPPRGLPPSSATLAAALVACPLAAAVALAAGAITTGGAAAGALLAALLLTFGGARELLLLGLFVAAASAATRIGRRAKLGLKGAHAGAGRRGAREAVANAGGAALLAVAGWWSGGDAVWAVALSGCLSTALSDTISSEIGQLARRDPILVTTLERVPRGTDGAVSLPGTLAGVAAAAVMAATAWISGLLAPTAAIAAGTGGLCGNLADSLLGATLERRGRLDNDAVNYLATATGALAAAGLYAAFTST